MKKTVYPLGSQVVERILSRENRFDKILIVPLDHAKKNHTVQFCFATGEYILKKAITVYNDSAGVAYLTLFLYFVESCYVSMCRCDPILSLFL